MSDYVRIKAIRFKINESVIKKIEKEIEEKNLFSSPEEILTERYNLGDYYDHRVNEFTINSGLDYDKDEYCYFLDYILDYEYGAGGDFESVRLLTDTEFEKYKKLFNKYFNVKKKDELRLVHYCYYNGVDEPSVWELEEV